MPLIAHVHACSSLWHFAIFALASGSDASKLNND